MLRWRRVAVGLALGIVAACAPDGGAFACVSDVECGSGICQGTGHCSFDDAECPSGQRYGAHSAELSGICVAPLETLTSGGTSTPAPPATTASDSDSSGSDATPPAGMTSTGPGAPETTDGTAPDTGEDTGEETGVADTGPSTSTGGAPPPVGDPYGPCLVDDDCTFPGAQCNQLPQAGEVGCRPPCDAPSDCPPPLGGTVGFLCGSNGCALDCAGAATCPTGMQCGDPFPACHW
ncbi:MAG: hypothetical protein AAF721_24775 [Myxococcota bacterium]